MYMWTSEFVTTVGSEAGLKWSVFALLFMAGSTCVFVTHVQKRSDAHLKATLTEEAMLFTHDLPHPA